MPKLRSKAQCAQIASLAAIRKANQSQENAQPAKTRRRAQENVLNEIIQQKETRIQDLEADLRAATMRANSSCAQLSEHNVELSRLQSAVMQNEDQLANTNQELLIASNALVTTRKDLQKYRRRIRRLEHDKKLMKSVYQKGTQETTAERTRIFTDLSSFAAEAKAKAEKLSALLEDASHELSAEKEANATLRKKVHRLDMQRRRAKETLYEIRQHFNKLRIWKSTRKGVFTPEARRLARALLRAGCAGDRVGDAIAACARVFHITVSRLPSRRTVFRARDEGGQFGLMQIGREITQSQGMVLLSTSMRTTL